METHTDRIEVVFLLGPIRELIAIGQVATFPGDSLVEGVRSKNSKPA
jgi:hypothetical protein